MSVDSYGREWWKVYLMYMRVGACAIPGGIVYGMYFVRFGNSYVVEVMAIITGLILAAIVEYMWRTRK